VIFEGEFIYQFLSFENSILEGEGRVLTMNEGARSVVAMTTHSSWNLQIIRSLVQWSTLFTITKQSLIDYAAY